MGESFVPKPFRPESIICHIFGGELCFSFVFEDLLSTSFCLLLLIVFYRIGLSFFYISLLSTKAISVFLSLFSSASLSS